MATAVKCWAKCFSSLFVVIILRDACVLHADLWKFSVFAKQPLSHAFGLAAVYSIGQDDLEKDWELVVMDTGMESPRPFFFFFFFGNCISGFLFKRSARQHLRFELISGSYQTVYPGGLCLSAVHFSPSITKYPPTHTPGRNIGISLTTLAFEQLKLRNASCLESTWDKRTVWETPSYWSKWVITPTR